MKRLIKSFEIPKFRFDNPKYKNYKEKVAQIKEEFEKDLKETCNKYFSNVSVAFYDYPLFNNIMKHGICTYLIEVSKLSEYTLQLYANENDMAIFYLGINDNIPGGKTLFTKDAENKLKEIDPFVYENFLKSISTICDVYKYKIEDLEIDRNLLEEV